MSGWVAAALMLAPPGVRAQELEPRSLTNVPVGMNFAVVAYGYSVGDILLDPAVPIDIETAKLHTVVGGYVRSISFFGLSSKIDVIAPFAAGDWEGTVEGHDSSTTRTGLGDPRARLSVNFVGAPALDATSFREYRQGLIVGASLQVVAPLGRYDSSRLINLGSNRWAFRSQIGASSVAGAWIVETYASVWFYTDNENFNSGNELSQRPLGALAVHAIRSLSWRRMWVAFDAGYAYGGRTMINGIEQDTRMSTFRLGFNAALPLARRHTLKLAGMTGVRHERGPDFDAIVLTYQYAWGGGR
jgi:hypothetical protein